LGTVSSIRDPKPKISVAIVSNRGQNAILSAIASVASQEVAACLQLVVVGDNPVWKPEDLEPCTNLELNAYAVFCGTKLKDLPPVFRVSRLRNVAVALCDGDYIAFLDDDNRWEPTHLASLLAALDDNKNAGAAHCWRKLVDRSGAPWINRGFPWGFDDGRKTVIYEEMLSQGIMSRKDNIFKDNYATVVAGEEIATVDMGSWLFRADFFSTMKFNVKYSNKEIVDSITEDDKLLIEMKEKGLTVACTHLPTLIYQVGGYSNAAK